MDDFNSAIDNVQKMAAIHFGNDVELLRGAKHKLTALGKIFSRFAIPSVILEELSAKVNAQVSNVAIKTQHPTVCLAEVIQILKSGLFEAGVMKAAIITTVSDSFPLPSMSTDSSPNAGEIANNKTDHEDCGTNGESTLDEDPPPTKQIRRIELERVEVVVAHHLDAHEIPATPVFVNTQASSSQLNEPLAEISSTQKTVSNNSMPEPSNERPNKQKQPVLSEGRVALLEAMLANLSSQIKELQAAELSLQDMESNNSPYMCCDRLEKRFCKVYAFLSKRQGYHPNPRTRFVYNASIYPKINEEITKFLENQKFPDYLDIRSCVVRANTEHILGIDSTSIDQIAKSAFIMIGNTMRIKRQRDFKEHFGNHLTDQALLNEDPAFRSPELSEKLRVQGEAGRRRLEELIDQFVQRQDEDAITRRDSDKEEDDNSPSGSTYSVTGEDEEDGGLLLESSDDAIITGQSDRSEDVIEMAEADDI